MLATTGTNTVGSRVPTCLCSHKLTLAVVPRVRLDLSVFICKVGITNKNTYFMGLLEKNVFNLWKVR